MTPRFVYAAGDSAKLSQVIIRLNTSPSPIVTSYTTFIDKIEKVPSPTPTMTPTPTPDPTREEIDNYIRQVFGQDAGKAFLLLTCENSSHDPNMVNTYGNTPEGSEDVGVFMINQYWQNVQPKFLFNYIVNIQIAHQLYVENGDSFKLWSCSSKLGGI